MTELSGVSSCVEGNVSDDPVGDVSDDVSEAVSKSGSFMSVGTGVAAHGLGSSVEVADFTRDTSHLSSAGMCVL